MKEVALPFTHLLVLCTLGMLVSCTQHVAPKPGAFATEPLSFKATDYSVRCVANSPDGKTLAVGGSAASRVELSGQFLDESRGHP
jgi:hypothetical protein